MWGWWDDEIFDDKYGFRNFSDIVSTLKVFRITGFHGNFKIFQNYFAFRNVQLGRSSIII